MSTAIQGQRYEHAVTLARHALDAVRDACDTMNVNARALSKTIARSGPTTAQPAVGHAPVHPSAVSATGSRGRRTRRRRRRL
ncbi:hypothetical protein ACFVRU_51640 [Streptomyces sp. NPDC057927]